MVDQDFWEAQYRAGTLGWDLGAVSAPLKAYFDQLEPGSLPILIPGAGNSYEARYLIAQGFTDVTVVDFSFSVTEKLKAAYRDQPSLHVVQGDFFTHRGSYHLIVEQTFFCAIDPGRRDQYVRHCHELLTKGGKIAGLLFNRDFEPGHPPFGGDAGSYEKLFAPYFHFRTWQPCYNSHPARAGSEWFMILEKKH